jgi:C4-type Zn-finger protein
MENIEIYCDRCRCLTSDKEEIPYRNSFHNYTHLCSSCRNYLKSLDKEKERRNKDAEEVAIKSGEKEWNKLKKKLYR